MARRKGQEEQPQRIWAPVTPQLLRAGQGSVLLNLLPSVIHELNNTLNTILGFADLLQSNPSLPKTLKEDLKAIGRAGLKARELLWTLKGLTKGVPAQIQPTPVNLREICEEVCSLMAATFRRNRIQLVTDYGSEPFTITSDATRLRFVLLALLQNACDAIALKGGGGKIFVKVERDQLGNTHFSIKNDGAALSPDLQPKLFEPFTTTKPAGEGTGLGLFLVHQLVTELKGKIEIRATEDGTQVTLFLPPLTFNLETAVPN